MRKHLTDFLICLAMVFALSFAIRALGANNPRSYQNITSTARYCASYKAPVFGLQCETPVRCNYGVSLTDGGTKQTSDGGMPMAPAVLNDLWTFPGDPALIRLGPAEQCIACVTSDGGSGGDAGWCTFSLDTASQ